MSTQTGLEDWQDHLEGSLQQDSGDPLIVRVYQETASTQDIAKTFAPSKALVVADHQSSGRGRLGRSWLASPGTSALMSLCWPIQDPSITHDRVSMLAGVAVARTALAFASDSAVRIKWPNDVMIDRQKLAGILIETVGAAYVIGIGLNVSHESCPDPSLQASATSLAEHAGPVDRVRVIERITKELRLAITTDQHAQTLDAWRALAELGQTQTFSHDGQQITGTVMDLDPDHGLIVRRDTGEIITLPAATTSVVA